MASVFHRKDRPTWYYKVKLGPNNWKNFPGFVDRRATEEKSRQHQARIDRGEVGLVDPYAEHKARPVAGHIADYVTELVGKGRDDVYCDNSRRFLERIVKECGWNRLSDITPDSIVNWRNSLERSAKTKNAYLTAARVFCNWIVQHGRMAQNPLVHVVGVEERGHETRQRRALSDDEIIRLLNVSGEYRIVYLAALTTGLRRGELAALTWGDVHLDAARPFINVRASISKNHKTATMFLRGDVADGLRAMAGADMDHPVFHMPGRKRFKNHLKGAGISAKDKSGRVVDFHALRHTFITGLSKAGVSPRVAMELARHSQIDLTMRVYTDAGMLGTADAVNALPTWTASEEQEKRAIATGTDDALARGTKTCAQGGVSVPLGAHLEQNTTREATATLANKNRGFVGVSDTRGDRIRTCDLLTPSQAR